MSKGKTVTSKMSARFHEDVLRWRGPITRFLGIDIGKSTGVCYVDVERKVCLTMQCSPDEISYALRSAQCEEHPAQVFIREMPHTSMNKRDDIADDAESGKGFRGMSPMSLYRLGISAGIATRATTPFVLSNAIAYEPMAASWRKVLGLNGGKREEVNDRVHRWAEADVKRLMRTRNGGAAHDEANAYAMTASTIHTVRSILSSPTQGALRL